MHRDSKGTQMTVIIMIISDFDLFMIVLFVYFCRSVVKNLLFIGVDYK